MDETLLAETFVAFADTLVTDFDVVDFFSMVAARCVDLFDAGAAGIMLADRTGHLHVVASSSHEMRLLELFELQHDEGPCPDAYHQAQRVGHNDLRYAGQLWPRFAPEAVTAGFLSINAFPLRLRHETIGALNLIRVTAGTLPPNEFAAAQALADVATIGLLHHRAAQESHLLADQLQYALDSRAVIEQAKGVIRESLDVNVDTAFDLLRRYSRAHNLRLVDVATTIIDHTLSPTALTTGQPVGTAA